MSHPLVLVLSVILLLPPYIAPTPNTYFIILRVKNTTSLEETSARFSREEQPNAKTEWECPSGPNPIIFEDPHHQAKSIDLQNKEEVICLGLSLRVVESKEVAAWAGEEVKCPGYFTTTTQLEISENNTTVQFKMMPERGFDVYLKDPTADCVRLEAVYVDPPKVSFTFRNKTVSGCHVITQHPDQITCNMTISTGDGEVLSAATGATQINVPQFIWRVELQTIECACECRISRNSFKNSTRRDILGYALPNLPIEPATTSPEHFTSSPQRELFLILVIVLSSLLFFFTVTTFVFLHVSRTLKRKLKEEEAVSSHYSSRPGSNYAATAPGHVPGNCGGSGYPGSSCATGHPASKCRMKGGSSATVPPCFEGHYSTLHGFRNECHHYNTVSLRLTDCLELSRSKGDSADKAVYQKLHYNKETDIYSTTTSV